MNMNAKKYGIKKLLSGLRRKFVLQISALEDKHTANLWDFCVTKGGNFGDQNYNKLLDDLGLDPSDRLKGASKLFKKFHEHQIFVYEIEEYVKRSPRVQYILLFEASWENALERIDRFLNVLVEGVRDRFAGQNPTQD